MKTITYIECVDVHKIYQASNSQLLEIAFPRDVSVETLLNWFQRVSRTLNTTASKIKNIYYGKSKLTSIEQIHIQDLARRQASTQRILNQLELDLGKPHAWKE